jgi:tetratricopeptide (TPR) repeat protein
MKKFVFMSLAILLSSFSFAQKKEIKEAEKAIKNNNYASAKTAIQSAESMMSSMDDKSKAKFYYLKGQAYYANGSGSDQDVTEALSSFKMLKDTEAQSGKMVYTLEADQLLLSMSNGFLDKAQNALNSKNHAVSSLNFERAYRTSSTDTLYLYNAAVLATSSKEYDRALELYSELTNIKYTGISTSYIATNVETGEDEAFPDPKLRDLAVMAKSHEKSRNSKSKSKVGEIAKNLALIYIEKGETEKALEAIANAKKGSSGDDINLILSEANVRYKLGEIDTYKELISKALKLEPNNADLLFNLGVVASDSDDYDEAKKYYDMAIAADPNYVRAYMNSAALVLDREQSLIDEMNSLGTSSADNKKYEELQDERTELYQSAIPYLTTVLELDPVNISAAKTLMNIYSVLGESDKFKTMQAKVAELEGGK